MTVSNNKTIAKTIWNTFGGENPKVYTYWDDNHESCIDILAVKERPFPKLTSISTIGLSDFSIGKHIGVNELRIEILGAYEEKYEYAPNMIATCAFYIINSKFSCYPGAIYQDVVHMYAPDSDMQHILFTNPFIWENELKTLEFEDKIVAWLLAVPISETERIYTLEHGLDALETLFEEKQINIFDLNRLSVI
ncbi:suppressor of fused domain protein [Ectobacillus panaciterrae]|uniref:suppressor of fused domain protein n=1 Tax=Ectobacillus panaciterrae TaxID=363872 RepID=UPI000401BF91|nr:suppressor of fused domain protein [Ectobacillus panaciterrae]